MLEPPPRSQSVSMGNECGNTLMDKDLLSFKGPGGIYTAKDCVFVSMPMPHTTELTNTPINPLACDSLAPSANTPGVRVSIMNYDAQARNTSQRKKPKTSLFRNKSNYMSKSTVYDRFNRLVKMDQDFGGLWVSVGRSIQLLPLGPVKSDALLRVLFSKAWPLCHVSGPGMELVCGMSSGDIVWIDAVSGKYTRINKDGNLTRAAVTSIAWFDVQALQVVAGHADGSVVIYDLDREDGSDMVPTSSKGSNVLVQTFNGNNSQNNPLRAYKLSNTVITDLLVLKNRLISCSRDGFLRALNLEQLIVDPIKSSNYGGLLTMAISPDYRYILMAGEDDTISLYNYETMELSAKFIGHTSWVRRVEFDLFEFDRENSLYRIGSVGEDGKMLLWDFGPSMLFGVGITQIYPSAEFIPKLDRVTPVPMSDLIFLKDSVAAVGSDGRIWTWTRPTT